MASIGCFMVFFRKITPKEYLVGYKGKKEEKGKKEAPSFFEGLRLLLSEGYLLGIFFIVSVYELIVSVIDNHFKWAVGIHFRKLGGTMVNANISDFMLSYGTWVGVVALVSLLLGASNIPRRFGVRVPMVMLPVLAAVAMFVVKINPFTISSIMIIMVFAKAVNYALNQPSLKQLYIPTSHEARYKSQGWIEMFGSRASKAGGGIMCAGFGRDFLH